MLREELDMFRSFDAGEVWTLYNEINCHQLESEKEPGYEEKSDWKYRDALLRKLSKWHRIATMRRDSSISTEANKDTHG